MQLTGHLVDDSKYVFIDIRFKRQFYVQTNTQFWSIGFMIQHSTRSK